MYFGDDVSPVGSVPVRVHDVTELPFLVSARPRGGFGVPQLALELALVSAPVSESVVTTSPTSVSTSSPDDLPVVTSRVWQPDSLSSSNPHLTVTPGGVLSLRLFVQ